MPRTRTPYPADFRDQIVALARTGRSIEDLAREFEPCAATIHGWVKQADRDGGRRTDGLTSEERDELRRLRRENRQLRQEMSRILGVSRSGYYAWRDRSPSARSIADVALADRIKAIHTDSKATYGAPRIHAELIDEGVRVGRKRIERLITRPHGIILVTGPTGSGKTTTLYAALSTINATDKNIITIEDPVEIQMHGIGQIEVHPKIGLTFATGLRSVLRQDPNVILVGEIRDRETAEVAIQASLTGHLVFSTLHTNDAPSAITRLVDMGVEPFLVGSSLVAVLAQRLVRVLCTECREAYEPSDGDLREIGLSAVERPLQFYRPASCAACNHTGYLGRLGIFELMIVDDDIRPMISQSVDSKTLKLQAVRKGMETLRSDGARKVLQGITSIAEILRATEDEGAAVEI